MVTDAALFDLLQRLFGLGNWDESVPWHRFRSIEIAKIKRSRTSRGVALEDLAVAAHYCKAYGLPVLAVTWLYPHIGDALRWDNARRRAASLVDMDELIASAIEVESSIPDSPWVDRLVRARGPYRQEVLAAWQASRSPRSSSSDQQDSASRPASSA